MIFPSMTMFVPKLVKTIPAALLSLLLLDGVQGLPALSSTSVDSNTDGQSDNHTLTGFPPCDALIAAKLSHITILPSSPEYLPLVNGTWNINARKEAWCFVQPSTPDEVSQTVVALSSAGGGAGDWHIAIRAGGHAGDNSNAIEDGVTIDLTHLNTTTYNKATNVANVGSGARWGSVYAALEKQGVTVTGGRQGVVGVGGLLLGGGISWYSGRTGFACDSVVNYEVVLASGEIINANASAHSNLWKALKGGSGNFGIVTRFDLETIPSSNLTIETTVVGEEHADEVMTAIADFVDLDRSFGDNAMISVLAYDPDSGETAVTVTSVNTKNQTNSTAFSSFKKLPTLIPFTQQSVTLVEAANSSALSSDTWSVGAGVLTLANTPEVLRYCVDQHHQLVADLNATLGPKSFSTLADFQPVSTYLAEISEEKGGNMLGLVPKSRNKIMFAPGVSLLVPNPETVYPRVYQMVAAMGQRIKAFSESIGDGEQFIYLPYSHANQDPLGSYGADNVAYMKQVAAKYDPHAFFQSRVPGGFKISRVKSNDAI